MLLAGQQKVNLACKKVVTYWFIDCDELTGVLHLVWPQLSSPPLPSSLAPINSRMETFWYWLTLVVLENGR